MSPDPGAPLKSHIVFMKGAPEIVLARCSEFMHPGGARPIDDDFKEDYTSAYERFGSCGERVLGFAFKVIPASKAEAYVADETLCPKDGLTFCGLVSLVDPPRPGVAEAIQHCRTAGIKARPLRTVVLCIANLFRVTDWVRTPPLSLSRSLAR